MAKNKIDFGSSLTLKQASNLIMTTGNTNRYLLVGEPGIGKSSLMGIMKEHFGEAYHFAYVDCSTLDLGDIGYPSMDHEAHVARFYPNVRFGVHTGKPVVIMLDEFGKAMQPVQNMLHPLLEVSNPRLGDISLLKGSIVFLTSNLGSDGVGDSIKAHTLNRVSQIRVTKPSADEWLDWAIDNNIDPVVMAWVKQFPHALASYLEGDSQKDNLYIYNPRNGAQSSYVSPRSLELASNVLKQRDKIDVASQIAAMSGTIGEAAARDLQAFVDYQDQLPLWTDIIKNPKRTKVPTAAGACAVLIFAAVTKVDETTLTPFVEYLRGGDNGKGFSLEWQAVFFSTLAKSSSKHNFIFQNKHFNDWVQNNTDVL